MKKLRLLFVLLWMTSNLFSSSVTGLLERIDKGASSKFIIERQKSETDFFELDQKGDKVIIRGNDYVNIATGLNWYLKYYAGIHLSWNGMTAKLPAVLPPVTKYKPQNKMFHFCKTFCSKITLVNTIQNVILNPI